MVPRGEAQRLLQLRRPPCRGRQGREGRISLGGRARGRPARDHVRRPPGRRRPLRERAQGARRREGDAGRDLHGDGSGVPGRDARLRAARGTAHGRLRRLLGGLALRSPERHGVRGTDHAGRGVAPRHDRPAQAERRRGAGLLARRQEVRRAASHRGRDLDGARARRLLGRDRRGQVGRSGVMSVRADGLRGSPLPALHERDDCQAEGHRPHDRGLSRRRRDDAPLHLRRQARIGLLVRGGRRLGHRAQLHRLRAARERDDERHVRGHAGLPGQGPLVGHRRAVQGRHPLHGSDGDPQPHEVGARAFAEARSVVASPARDRSANRSTPRPGCGTASTSAATSRRSSTPGGRPRPG